MPRRLETRLISLAAVALVVIGLGIRLYDLNWDDNHHIHPDERWITMVAIDTYMPAQWTDALDPRRSALNPYWNLHDNQFRSFAYGSFPLYLVRATATGVSALAVATQMLPEWLTANDYDHLNLVGRVLSAIFDTLTIGLVFLLGRRIFSPACGLLAAAFATFSVQQIQLAHFYAFDVVTTTVIVAALYFGVRVVQNGKLSDSLWLGALVALAVASKFSALPLVLVLVLAHVLRPILRAGTAHSIRPTAEPGAVESPPQVVSGEITAEIIGAIGRILLTLSFALLVFAIASPFTFLDFNGYASSISEQSNIVRGIADLPYTRQYRNTGPTYYVENLVFWGMGPLLGIAGIAGLGLLLTRAVRRSAAPSELLMLAWVLPYGLITFSFMVKFLRYLAPVTPFLCLMAAYFLWRIARAGTKVRIRKPLTVVRYVPLAAVLGATIVYAYAFMQIYTTPLTRVQASDWIYRNIPAGATITDESWDDSLPFARVLDGRARFQGEFKVVTMNLHEPDDASKLDNLRQWVDAADYIIISSNRMYGWLPRLADRFPMTERYYDLLFSDGLGFQKVAEFTSYPRLGSLVLNDDHADESFTVYDHPKVLIYRKTRALSTNEFNALFADTLPRQGDNQLPAAAVPARDKSLMLDRPVDELPVVSDRAWNPLAQYQPLAIVGWWAVVELLGLLALPLTLSVFARFADGGYILAKSLGLLLVAYVVWLVASFHLVIQHALMIWVVALVLLLMAAQRLLGRRRQFAAFLRDHWRTILLEEALFALAFGGFVIIRMLDPDLWQPWNGGEKSMEFAFLNAILKSPYFPPYDPYFAGGYINYYYYGIYLVGVLTKLTGVLPEVAFNLAIPTLFALTVVNAFSVAFNIASLSATTHSKQRLPSDGTEAVPLGDHLQSAALPSPVSSRPMLSRRALVSGLLAALFIAALGNLDGWMQIVEGLGKAAGGDFHTGIIGLDGLVKVVQGTGALFAGGKSLLPFDYWRSSRVIPFTINEFPLWSFLFSDLHPHMIGIPFTLLAISLAAHQLLRPQPHPVPDGAGGHELDGTGELMTPLAGGALHTRIVAVFVRGTGGERAGESLTARSASFFALALTLGAIAAINTWDAPTYLGLGAGALVLALYQSGTTRPMAWLRTLAATAAVAAFSILMYWPFFNSYKALFVGLGISDIHTDFQPFVVMWGFFLCAGLSFVAGEAARRTRKAGPARFMQAVLRNGFRLPRVFELGEALRANGSTLAGGIELAAGGLALLLLMSIALLALGLAVPALLIWPFALSTVLLLRRNLAPHVAFMNWLAFWAFAILLGVEVVYLQDFLGGDWKRMNTLFKFYIQVWVLLGLLAALALPELWARISARRGMAAPLWQTAMVMLGVACLIFPLLGTIARVNDRFPGSADGRPPLGTLDGLAYMSVGTYHWPDEQTTIEMRYDLDAIHWLQSNVDGTPVIAEAAIGYYREGGMRVSSYTGLPTLLGMHQSEQRYADDVGKRDGEARDFFNTKDSARAMDLIRSLHIRYIYIGQLERIQYDAAGIAKFDAMRRAGVLEIAYENPKVKIYRVRVAVG
jgi:YYY domain-containing protein